jgi:tetratricopeptide (TPR) repeat protein
VGRDRELGELTLALDLLDDGRGSLFLVSGEPGIGKTRLVDELSNVAQARGLTVAWGAAWDGGGAPALWPWIQVLRALRPSLPPPNERLRRDLGPLWDGEVTESGLIEDAEVQQFRRFDALRALLAEAAARGPVLVVLEDLHAADRASLLAMEFIGRALRTMRLLVVGTHREAEARLNPGLGELVARIARQGSTLVLSSLQREEIARMLSALEPVSDHLVDEILFASGGNPLFITEALRHLRSGGLPRDIPSRVGAIIAERISRFEPPVRQALGAAAVLGREFEFEVLAEVCGISVVEAQERLRAPLLSGILTKLPDGRTGFAHPLFRESLDEGLEAGKRSRVHLDAARVLIRRSGLASGATDQAIAHHLLSALPEGDPAETVEWAARAGESAFRALAFDRATRFFEGALSALERTPADPARQIDLQLRLAETLARTGAGPRNRTMCRSAAGQARALGDPLRLAHAALGYGAELRVGVVDPVLVGLLEEALAAVGETELALRARLMARLAAARQPASDPLVPIQLAHDAIALARRVDDPETNLSVLYTAGSAFGSYAPPAVRRPVAQELISRALAKGDLLFAQRGYERLSIDASELGDLYASAAAAEAAERAGAVLGEPRWRWRGALLRSMCAMAQGRWAEAERSRAEAEVWVAQVGPEDPRAAFSLALHHIGAFRARETGKVSDVFPWVRAAEAAMGGGPPNAPPMSEVVRATIHARFGELDAARRVLDGLGDVFEQVCRFPSGLLELADVTARLADEGRARTLLPLVERLSWPAMGWANVGYIWQGFRRQFVGGLLAVLGRWGESVAAFEEALSAAQLAGAAPTTAHLRLQLAEGLLARGERGDPQRAAELLEAAASEARALDMPHLAARVERGRGALGSVAAAAPEGGGDAPGFRLDREGEVWSLTSGGRTVRLKHSRGLEILDLLVRHPGRQFHVLELGPPPPGEAVDAGDAGEVLDAAAVQAYRQRLRDLEEELHEAESWSDAGRGERLRAELDFLQVEMAQAVGLGGRSRRVGAAAERARVNVQKRLRGVIRRIAAELPELGRYLDREVQTGLTVCYRHGR